MFVLQVLRQVYQDLDIALPLSAVIDRDRPLRSRKSFSGQTHSWQSSSVPLYVEAISTAVYLYNISPSQSNGYTAPFLWLRGHKWAASGM